MAFLFFDIDGTLLDDKNYDIPKSAVHALKLAKEKGHEIFVNTGRTFCCIPEVLNKIGFHGYLCACGTHLTYGSQVLFSRVLEEEKGYEYVRQMKTFGVEAVLEGVEDLYYSKEEYRYSWFRQNQKEYARDLGVGLQTFIEDWDYRIQKMLIYVDEQSQKEKFFEAISDEMDPIDRKNGFYECVQKNYSKATAIDYIRKYLGADMGDIYVFGDSSNDLTMFEYAEHTIAMGKHDAVLEPYTEYITDTVENDGIYKALKYYKLI